MLRRRCGIFLFVLLLLSGCQSYQQDNAGDGFFNFFPLGSRVDESITLSVRDALMQKKILKTTPIYVETRGGVVSLSGYVKTIRQSDTAEMVARQVQGVKQVENNLVVRK